MAKQKRSKHRGIKVLRLHDGRHVARFRDPISDKPKQQSLDVLGLTTAKAREFWAIEKLAELQKLRAQIAASGVAQVRKTVEQAQHDYLDLRGNVNTRLAKLPAFASFAEWVAAKGVVDVQDITGPVIFVWRNHVHRPANPHKISTRNLYLSVIAAWLRWCIKSGTLPRVTRDDVRGALEHEKAPHDRIEVLAPSELRALLRSLQASDAAGERPIAAFALFVLLSGMRYGEAEGLTWPEVDFDGKMLRLGSASSKTRTARDVTLAESPAALELLGALRLRSGDSKGHVFVGVRRDLIEVCRKRTMRRYDAPRWTWHMLRRTCGSLICSAGVLGAAGPFLTAKRLGHSVQVAERHYQTAFHNLPTDAKTIEQAAGIEDLAGQIVRSVSDVQPCEAAAS